MASAEAGPVFMNGVNYGDVFIPEDFFADADFFEKNGIPKVADQYSLCDFVGKKHQTKAAMERWLKDHIVESEFAEMKAMGINVLRLPLGYWHLVDMPGNPNAEPAVAERQGHLKDIMPAADYRPYIDQVTRYAGANGIQVLYDLHGAPGGQSGESNAGCSTKGFALNGVDKEKGSEGYAYWDTPWNQKWTTAAFAAMAQICKDAGDTCYGLELLNEPLQTLSRDSLEGWYQHAIQVARRDVLLPHHVPIVVMDWMGPIQSHWLNRWHDAFPEATYGKVLLETHIYDFKNTVAEEQQSWDAGQWPSVKAIAAKVPLFIGEYTLSLNRDIPTHELHGWASWITGRLHDNGTLGGAHWLWNNKARKYWSMRSMSTLETNGGVDWARVFSHWW